MAADRPVHAEDGLSVDAVEQVLRRAFELDAESRETSLPAVEVVALGLELGISRVAMDRALAEQRVAPPAAGGPSWLDRVVGPAEVTVGLASRRRRAALEADLARRLARRHLMPVQRSSAGGVWEQRVDWWPDVARIAAPTRVAVTTRSAGPAGPLLVEMRAQLDEARRAHLVGAAAGLGVLPLVLVGLAPAVALAAAGGALLSAFAGYRYRRRSVAQRMQALLSAVAEPGAAGF